MMVRTLRYVVLCLLLSVTTHTYVQAQSVDELDYLKFKYYEDDEDELWWLAEDVDSIMREQPSLDESSRYDSFYELRGVQFSRRGEEYHDQRYMLGELSIDNTTSRLMSRLGVERQQSANRVRYMPHASPRRGMSQRVRAELPGRGYLASLSYSGSHQLSQRGVVLDDDWLLRSYIGVNTGRDLYIDGVSRKALDMALSAERSWINNSLFVAMLLPWSSSSERQYSVEEAFTILDNPYYNPAWGMHNGVPRSSRLKLLARPEMLLSWQRRLSAWTQMSLSLRAAYDRTERSSLAWFDTHTPMPDNYRKLPSFFSDAEYGVVYDVWSNNVLNYTQIDWDRLYRTNALQQDGHAAFILENRVYSSLIGGLNLKFSSQLRGVDLDYGLISDVKSERRFKLAKDMLGADHILDVDYFIKDDATQGVNYRNNLRDDDFVVHEGDRFGYDYRLTTFRTLLFARARWSLDDMQFELGASLGGVLARRYGYYEKELFASVRSYGASRNILLTPASLDALWSYRVNNHNFNAMLEVCGDVPQIDAMFLQADYNNRVVEQLGNATILRAQMGYGFATQRLRLDASLFVLHRGRECDVVHYYDDIASEYVDAVIRNIERTGFGVELDGSVSWTGYLSSRFSLSAARYGYSDDAEVLTYADDDNTHIATSKALMRGCRAPGAQLASYADIRFYRSGWGAVLSARYWGGRYVEPSYIRRTERFIDYAHSPEERSALLSQQRLDDALMLGVSVSKSLRLGGGCRINISLGVDNILASKIVYGGYEQNRVRRSKSGYYTAITPFADKLRYAYGRTFRLRATLSF